MLSIYTHSIRKKMGKSFMTQCRHSCIMLSKYVTIPHSPIFLFLSFFCIHFSHFHFYRNNLYCAMCNCFRDSILYTYILDRWGEEEDRPKEKQVDSCLLLRYNIIWHRYRYIVIDLSRQLLRTIHLAGVGKGGKTGKGEKGIRHQCLSKYIFYFRMSFQFVCLVSHRGQRNYFGTAFYMFTLCVRVCVGHLL